MTHPTLGAVYWLGPYSAGSGYGEECRAMVSALLHANVDVRVIDIVEPNRVEDIDAVEAHNAGLAASVLDSMPQRPSDVYVYHRCWAARPLLRQGRHYWRTMFETSALPTSWVDSSRDFDGLWVPSTFNFNTFRDAGVEHNQLSVIHAPNPEWLPPRTRKRSTGRITDFLFVGKWEDRKGTDLLLDAFTAAFDASDDARLILKTQPFNDAAGDHDSIRQEVVRRISPRSAPIVLIDKQLAHPELLALYKRAACFVAPSRGEGWGRGTIEALLAGLPVITTNWGGSTEFLPFAGEQARGLSWQLAPCSDRAVREWAYFEGQTWAEPDMAQFVQELRQAAEQASPGTTKESASAQPGSAFTQTGPDPRPPSKAYTIANRFRGDVIARQIVTALGGESLS